MRGCPLDGADGRAVYVHTDTNTLPNLDRVRAAAIAQHPFWRDCTRARRKRELRRAEMGWCARAREGRARSVSVCSTSSIRAKNYICYTHTGAVSEPESSSQTPWPGSTAFGIIQKDTFYPRRALARSQREIIISVCVCVRMRPIDTVSKIENTVFYSRRGMSRKVLLLNYITRCQHELN